MIDGGGGGGGGDELYKRKMILKKTRRNMKKYIKSALSAQSCDVWKCRLKTLTHES